MSSTFPRFTDSIDINFDEKKILNELLTGELELFSNFKIDVTTIVRKICLYNNHLYLIALGYIPYVEKEPTQIKQVKLYTFKDEKQKTLKPGLYFRYANEDDIKAGNYIPIDNKNIYALKILDGKNIGIKLEDIPSVSFLSFSSRDMKNESKIIKDFSQESIPLLMNKIESANIEELITEEKPNRIEYHHNIIISGAPGTGKSYIVENNIVPKIIENNTHPEDKKKYMSRIVFTSSTSYEDFFGCYKPTPIEFNGEPRITYKFVPGIFTSILLKAQNNKEDNYVLVIEEINRADVYDVFGQIFQLLDRKDTDESEYGIDVPEDSKDYFKTDEKIVIPSNLFIVCTMNSADQGVRVLDTAFKRRFSMAYMDIDNNLFCSSRVPIKEKKIQNNNKAIDADDYHRLRKEINKILIDEQFGEDKLIAERFVKVGTKIEEVEFVINILGYLIQNVYRNRDLSSAIFNDPEQRQMVSLLKAYSSKGLNAILSTNLSEILNKENKDA